MRKSIWMYSLILWCAGITAVAQVDNDNTLIPVWRATQDVFGRGNLIASGLDVDHDGKGELFVYDLVTNTTILFEEGDNDNYVNVLELDGERNIGDLNRDGNLEFISIISDPVSQKAQLAFYEWNGLDLDGINSGLKETPIVTSGTGFRGDFTNSHLASRQLLPLNVDQDPNIELYSHIIDFDKKQTTVYAYELDISNWTAPTLMLQDSFAVIPENYIHGPALLDLNKDGYKEILFLSNYRNMSYVWPVISNTTYGALVKKGWDSHAFTSSRWHNDQVVVDANRDGTDEIYIGTYYGETYYLEPKPTIEETFTEANSHRLRDLIPNPQLDMMTMGFYGDHDQDGLVDLYYHSRDDAWLIDLEYKGGPVADSGSYDVYNTVLTRFDGVARLSDAYWTIGSGYYQDKNGYFASDMDKDGKREVVIAGLQESLLSAGQPTLVVFESTVAATSVKENDTQLPTRCQLMAPYPNPFNASTRIVYELPVSGMAKLEAYDVAGRLIEVIEEGTRQAGRHTTLWQPQNLSSGVYMIALRLDQTRLFQRAVLLK